MIFFLDGRKITIKLIFSILMSILMVFLIVYDVFFDIYIAEKSIFLVTITLQVSLVLFLALDDI